MVLVTIYYQDRDVSKPVKYHNFGEETFINTSYLVWTEGVPWVLTHTQMANVINTVGSWTFAVSNEVNSAEHYLEALKAARGQSSAKACAKNRPAPGTNGAGFGASVGTVGDLTGQTGDFIMATKRGPRQRNCSMRQQKQVHWVYRADAMTHGSIGVKMAVGKVLQVYWGPSAISIFSAWEVWS